MKIKSTHEEKQKARKAAQAALVAARIAWRNWKKANSAFEEAVQVAAGRLLDFEHLDPEELDALTIEDFLGIDSQDD